MTRPLALDAKLALQREASKLDRQKDGRVADRFARKRKIQDDVDKLLEDVGARLKIEAVLLREQGSLLADFIFEQMMEEGHYWETPTTYEPTITRGFVTIREHPYGKDRSLPLRDVQQPVTPRGDTRKYLFNGFSKCGWDTQRFHSDDERRFAVLIDKREAAVKVCNPGRERRGGTRAV